MKSKIYATGNETLKGEFNISYYIFEKDPSFLDWLGKLLVEVLEIQGGEHKAKNIVNYPKDAEGRETGEEIIYIKDITKMIDIHEKYEGNKKENKSRIDVFYGKDRVYITLRKSKEIREKFTKFIEKTKDWIEVKETLEVPIYAERRK